VAGGALNCRVGFAQAGSWGPLLGAGTPTFDHSDEMFQDGYQNDTYLTVSGGNERTTFFLSGGYNQNRGIVVGPNSEYRRIAVRFNGTSCGVPLIRLAAGGRHNQYPSSRLLIHERSISRIFPSRRPTETAT